MDEQTRSLLKECSAGCKMAINSLDQVREYIREEELKKLTDQFDKKHKELEEEAAKLLEAAGEEEKEPGKMAEAFSRITTEMKLMLKDDSGQIAKLLMDGCNMGIQSIGKYSNEYTGASKESKAIAARLIKTEEDYMAKLKQFL